MAGALAWSSVTVNEPQLVLKTSLYVFSGSRRSFGSVAPPSSRASGTVTSLQPSAPTVAAASRRSVVVALRRRAAVSSDESPQPGREQGEGENQNRDGAAHRRILPRLTSAGGRL